MRRQVPVRGGVLEYVDTGGDGPVLVLLHGALMDHRLWVGVVDAIGDRARCVVPILPMGAHRLPFGPDADLTPTGQAGMLGELVAHLDCADVALVGNDTGGAVAQLLVAGRPGCVSRLALVSCDAYDNFPPGLPGRTMALSSRIPGGLPLAVRSLRSRVLRRLPMTFGWMSHRPIDDATFDAWIGAYGDDPGVRQDLARMLAGVDRTQLTMAAEGLTSFAGPAMVIWGADDRVMPLEHAERLAATIPAASLHLVPDSRTLVPIDQPGALVELLLELVARTR